jgi:hypothetical protein
VLRAGSQSHGNTVFTCIAVDDVACTLAYVHYRKIRECVGFITDFKYSVVNNFMIDYPASRLLYHRRSHTNFCILQLEFFCQFCLFINRPDAILTTHHVTES